MRKPTRTILALTATSLVLGGVGAGAAVADDGPMADSPAQELVVLEPDGDQAGTYQGKEYSVGKVVSRGPLTLRYKPTSHSKSVGHVRPDHRIAIVCKVRGESIDGNDIWYLLHVKEKDDRETDGRQPRDQSAASNSEDGEDGEDGAEAKDRKDHKGRKDQKDRKDRKDREDREDRKDQKDREDREDRKDQKDRKDRKDREDREDREDQKDQKDRKEHKGAWVTARYVKNLRHVEWCD